MACYNPLRGWQSATVNPSGKRSITFNIHDALTDRPVDVPCGKCVGCRADQSMMWSIRAYHESTLHTYNSFLTLTYDDGHLPEDGKISKKHLQDFFKRMRHKYKFRYIACGEYGDKTRRPHYHALIFGQSFDAAKHTINIDDKCYTNTDVEKTWGHGNIMIAEVNLATVMYVCGYVNKKIDDEDTFMLSSRRPGIGKDWLVKWKDEILNTGTVVIEGREFAVPPRYLEWEESFLQEVREARRQYVKNTEKASGAFTSRNLEMNRKAKLNKRKKGDV